MNDDFKYEELDTVSKMPVDIIQVRHSSGREVVRIAPDGRIFWLQREVITDDEFRSAMLELKDALLVSLKDVLLVNPTLISPQITELNQSEEL